MLVRKRRQTGLSVSNLALLLIVFKWYHGSEWVNLFSVFGSCFRMLASSHSWFRFFFFFFCTNSDWRNLKCGRKALQVNGCTSMVTVLHHIELGFPEHTLTLRHQRDFAPIITYRAWYAQIWFLAGEPLIKYINTAKYLEDLAFEDLLWKINLYCYYYHTIIWTHENTAHTDRKG